MPYYLSEYIGSGTDRDPCRPLGSDQPGWSAIDRRADDGATPSGNGLNVCFLYPPVANADARLYKIADVQGEIVPPVTRAGIAARLNATLNFPRLDDLIADHLLRPPGHAGRPIVWHPTRPLAIYLHGLLSPSPALRTLLASFAETWTHVNAANTLTADLTWTLVVGTDWGIVGNAAELSVSSSGSNYGRAEVDAATSDHKVTATLTTYTTGASWTTDAVLICRWGSAGTSNLYRFTAINSGGAGSFELGKIVASVSTVIATDTTDPAAGMALEISAIGSTIQGQFDATVVGPVTDTGVPGNTRGGIGAYIDNTFGVLAMDNWRIRDAYTGILPRRDPMAHMLVR